MVRNRHSGRYSGSEPIPDILHWLNQSRLFVQYLQTGITMPSAVTSRQCPIVLRVFRGRGSGSRVVIVILGAPMRIWPPDSLRSRIMFLVQDRLSFVSVQLVYIFCPVVHYLGWCKTASFRVLRVLSARVGTLTDTLVPATRCPMERRKFNHLTQYSLVRSITQERVHKE